MNLVQKLKFRLAKFKLTSYLLRNQVAGESFNVYLNNGKFTHKSEGEQVDSPEYKFVGKFSFYKEYSPYNRQSIARLVEIELDVRSSYHNDEFASTFVATTNFS